MLLLDVYSLSLFQLAMLTFCVLSLCKLTLRMLSSLSLTLLSAPRFAKGPLYFLSTPIVTQLLSSEWIRRDLNATIRSIDEYDPRAQPRMRLRIGATASAVVGAANRVVGAARTVVGAARTVVGAASTVVGATTATPVGRGLATRSVKQQQRISMQQRQRSARRLRVWEDVYTGYLLARVIGGSGLAVVESGFGNGRASPHYSDGYGKSALASNPRAHAHRQQHPSFHESCLH